MNPLLKEFPVYLAVAIGSLLIMCFFVHAMVGGLVRVEIEYSLYVLICLVDIVAMGFMTRDVIRRRRKAAQDQQP